MLHYEMPLVIGWDVSGIIKEVGANVTELKVGDEVFSRPEIARQGTYAEYVFMQPTGERLKKIAEAVEKGELKPVIDRVFDLEDTKLAHDYGEEGHAKGKIVIKVK